MKVHLLENAVDQYISSCLEGDTIEWYFPHSLVGEFHTHWSLPASPGLKEVYDQCLRSEYSQRWWKQDHYRPREIMLNLIDADPELATIAWKDLANEASPLDGRLSRFDYYCNELLQIHRQKDFRAVETYHHQDAAMISLYLAGLSPSKYALYPGLNIFQSFCRSIGSQDIPKVDDLVRYMKVATIVWTYLQRNPHFQSLLRQRDQAFHKVVLVPFQLSYEMITFEGNRYNHKGG